MLYLRIQICVVTASWFSWAEKGCLKCKHALNWAHFSQVDFFICRDVMRVNKINENYICLSNMEKEKSNSYRWKMLTITCSKSTIGTLEKGVEYAQS